MTISKMNGQVLDSTTYVEPLEREETSITVLTVGLPDVALDGLRDAFQTRDDTLDVRAVSTEEEALDTIADVDVDCILSAQALSDSSGLKLFGSVCSASRDRPFVLNPADGSESLAARAIKAGIDGYVPADGHSAEACDRLAASIEDAVADARATDRLVETSQLLLRLTEYTDDTLWMFTGDWNETILVNAAYESVWDRPLDGLIEDPGEFLDGIHPDDREAILTGMEVLSNGDSTDIEYRIATDDGERWLSVHAEPVFDDDGEVAYVAGFTRDITEHRRRERLEREANERLETLVENIPVVLFTLDSDGVFTSSVGKGLETLGLDTGQLNGVSVYDAYAEYDDITDAVDRALAGEEVRVTQELDDGLTFETWYRPVFDDAGDLSQIVGVARDITALERRHERLERVTRATQQLPNARSERDVAEITVDIAAAVIDCPVVGWWRYEAETDALLPTAAAGATVDVAGDEASDALPKFDPGDDVMDVFSTGTPQVVEEGAIATLSLDGSGLEALYLFPVGDRALLAIGSTEAGHFEGFERNLIEILGRSATDALERVIREAELESQREDLKRSNENLQQFAYTASHDLQEPLRMVASYVDLIEQEYGDKLDEEGTEYVEFAVNGARRMQAMIDALLQYARVQTRAQDFEETDPNEVLDDTLDGLKMRIQETNARITQDSFPLVKADPNQLGQVFQNLIKNGITHGARTTGPPEIEVSARATDGVVTFLVADNGPGIDASVEDDVFEIFKRGSTDDDGTGIGLALCQRIVNRHDGKIWVESSGDGGTTLAFSLPAPVKGVPADD